ncbi:MAG: HNH endonuclease [Methanoregula sp.]|jgi:hypothetical protein|nr:HNH endonuclease [Methanoregula sp.]
MTNSENFALPYLTLLSTSKKEEEEEEGFDRKYKGRGIREIQLTRGKVALVDDEDFEELNRYRWHVDKNGNTFYAVRNCDGGTSKTGRTKILMHRIITGISKELEIDHIDGNGLNNQKSNLRKVTHRKNGQNRHQEKTSRFPGVCWHKCSGSWISQLRINGKVKYLGLSKTEEEAHQKYKEAVLQTGVIS